MTVKKIKIVNLHVLPEIKCINEDKFSVPLGMVIIVKFNLKRYSNRMTYI